MSDYWERNSLISLKLKEMINHAGSDVNYMRSFFKGENSQRFMKNALIHSVVRRTIEPLIEKLELIGKGKRYYPKTIVLAGVSTPNMEDQILISLTRKFFINNIDAIKMSKVLRRQGLNVIPGLYINCHLEAIFAAKHGKEAKNNTIDNLRISSCLPYVDILITDAAKKFDIQEAGLDKKFKTKVLSGKNDDVLELKGILYKIIQ